MVKIIQGDALTVLKTLPDESVNCCVTSPPYWGLRDYGTGRWEGGDDSCQHKVGGQVKQTVAPYECDSCMRPGVDASVCKLCGARRIDQQLGLERTPEEYVAKMVEVFREVRRVLCDDGTLWLNLGDSYVTKAHGNGDTFDPKYKNGRKRKGDNHCNRNLARRDRACVLPAKIVCGNGLKHKDLVGIPWMVAFALRADGWYLRQDIVWNKSNPMPESVTDRCTKAHEYIFLMSKSQRYYFDAEQIKEPSAWPDGPNSPESIKSPYGQGFTRNNWKGSKFHTGKTATHQLGRSQAEREEKESASRNKRSVWTVSTAPFPGAHFATFPPKLIEPCILAGCPMGGTVLDPFGGSGTVGMVSENNGRNSILIELNQKYCEMAKRRTSQVGLPFAANENLVA